MPISNDLRTAIVAALLIAPASDVMRAQPVWSSEEPPPIPIGYDAFLQWDRWPYLRIGVRAYMKSTFDRSGGNHNADAAHFIRQEEDGLNVALEETGPGILWFVRHNHWHGSPWHYTVDGETTIVTESSTADPLNPVEESVFQPEELFPRGLTWTWSDTKGADLSWVPIPFEQSFKLSYGRARYGTGYFIFWKVMPGLYRLSHRLRSWDDTHVPPQEVLDLLGKAGRDIAPSGTGVTAYSGEVDIEPHGRTVILDSAEGPQMLRVLSFSVSESQADALAKMRLRVWWDDRPAPSIDAPLALFFGTGSLNSDPGQEYIVKAFPMTVRKENDRFLFATYFPMPFQKRALIVLENEESDRIEDVSWKVRMVRYTDPANWVGWFHATYRDIPRPEPGRDLELLDTRQVEGGGLWSGHLVGTTYLFTQNNVLSTLEGDPRFYFDDSLTPQVQGTGSEEWGGGGDYWGGRTMTLPFAGHPVGKPPDQAMTAADSVHSAYRFLLTDLMPFGRSARVTLEHGGENQSTEHYETVAYWYGLNRPFLELTDELDVGDPASERHHTYITRGGMAPDTLISRFEWGVDRREMPTGREVTLFDPVADVGRRTRGAEEFTIHVRPDNLGVLLRRRLDLAVPNQKARVYVSQSEHAAEPDWVEAGVWYTAGGNTVVFADPNIVPPEERTVPLEIAPPAKVIETSHRRFREVEFMLPRPLTEGRERMRIRVEHVPVNLPLVPGGAVPESWWTAYRYTVYSFVMPEGGD